MEFLGYRFPPTGASTGRCFLADPEGLLLSGVLAHHTMQPCSIRFYSKCGLGIPQGKPNRVEQAEGWLRLSLRLLALSLLLTFPV